MQVVSCEESQASTAVTLSIKGWPARPRDEPGGIASMSY
jgi:hypothetical protein